MNEKTVATHLMTLLSEQEHITGIQAIGTEEDDKIYTVTVHILSAAHRRDIMSKVMDAVAEMQKDLPVTPLEITIQLSYDSEA